ncbi:MAG TPA: protein-S-isoprenylcysteine O-methyltransferase [Candidatus Dormibacteraeota bacterium]|nr:protein-S-isoprenylcysteine O-methyltransferase [Candidatus Dormibacteraeota bacterium]
MTVQLGNLIFLAGLIVYVTIRGVFERRTRNLVKVVKRRDALERALLVMVGIGSLALPVLYLFTPWLGFADYRLPPLAQVSGTVILLCALWLFWRSHHDLAENWSMTLELHKGHRLIQHGVYRLIRHPMYAAILLWDVAQGLLLQNWLAGSSAFITFFLLYLFRTPREEQMLCEFFGQEYRDYMRKTGRLFPRLR